MERNVGLGLLLMLAHIMNKANFTSDESVYILSCLREQDELLDMVELFLNDSPTYETALSKAESYGHSSWGELVKLLNKGELTYNDFCTLTFSERRASRMINHLISEGCIKRVGRGKYVYLGKNPERGERWI